MKKEIIPIGELKFRLLHMAESGMRIMHNGSCLFSGFAINQSWNARGPVLKSRLETLVVEGAMFEVLIDVDNPSMGSSVLGQGNPISTWEKMHEYLACTEPEV